jgi:4-hydroxybenzoate polyprenyltransferase
MAVLAGYYVLTVAYSLWLKKIMVIDVVTLACLYGVRLVAGGAACVVPLSFWLVALAVFLFFSLALVKRCTEIIDSIDAGKGDPSGRGYRLTDLPMLESMAAASGYIGVLVSALYVNNPAVTRLYGNPNLLWLTCIVLIFWLSRILLLTHRGEMHDDPVVFAATDRTSVACLVVIAVIVIASI